MQGEGNRTSTRGRPRKGRSLDTEPKRWYRIYSRGLVVGFKCVAESGTLYYDISVHSKTSPYKLRGSTVPIRHDDSMHLTQAPG